MLGKGDKPEVEETPEQKEAAAVAMEKWEHYNDNYVPVENEYMRRVDAMDSDNQHDLATGSANKSYSEAFDGLADSVAGREMHSGAEPGSGRFAGGLSDVRVEQGKATAGGLVDADQAQETRHAGGVRNIVNMGQGVSADAQMGLQDVANRSASNASSAAVNDFKTGQDNRELVGMAAGGALAYGLNNDKE